MFRLPWFCDAAAQAGGAVGGAAGGEAGKQQTRSVSVFVAHNILSTTKQTGLKVPPMLTTLRRINPPSVPSV